MKTGIQPIMDEETRVLILGSLPGDESIRLEQYYANPKNDFWVLIGAAINENITKHSYESKIERLKKHGIGLWDVFSQGDRSASLDSNISNATLNDFSDIKTNFPNVHRICLNGKKAGECVHCFKNLGYDVLVLPSSSGANRKDAVDRAEIWGNILK